MAFGGAGWKLGDKRGRESWREVCNQKEEVALKDGKVIYMKPNNNSTVNHNAKSFFEGVSCRGKWWLGSKYGWWREVGTGEGIGVETYACNPIMNNFIISQ